MEAMCPYCCSKITLDDGIAIVSGVVGGVCWSTIAMEGMVLYSGGCPSCDNWIRIEVDAAGKKTITFDPMAKKNIQNEKTEIDDWEKEKHALKSAPGGSSGIIKETTKFSYQVELGEKKQWTRTVTRFDPHGRKVEFYEKNYLRKEENRTVWVYDNQGNIIKEEYNNGYKVFEYDKKGVITRDILHKKDYKEDSLYYYKKGILQRVEKIFFCDGYSDKQVRAYDESGRIVEELNYYGYGCTRLTYSYSNDGRVVELYGGSEYCKTTYDEDGRIVEQLSTKDTSPEGWRGILYDYTFDEHGRTVRMCLYYDREKKWAERTECSEYDERGNLLRVETYYGNTLNSEHEFIHIYW